MPPPPKRSTRSASASTIGWPRPCARRWTWTLSVPWWEDRACRMPSRYEDLLDYRRRVGELYASVREATLDPACTPDKLAETCRRFRAGRDALFRTHPQSAFAPEQRPGFAGLRY